jgi:hypothetical protein
MDPLWLLEGTREAPGWGPLEKDARAGTVDLLLFDRAGWALLRAAEAPGGYPGLVPTTPPDGLFLDDRGRGLYLVAGQLVPGPREVIAALGPQAQELLQKLGDPDTVLDRLGRVR